MDWNSQKHGWPHAGKSRFIPAGTLGGRWHVQEMGEGPDILLLHGAGGATQSWRGLMPLLATRYRCLAIDLPGQGFSRPRVAGRYSLNAMADDIASLAAAEGWRPKALIGHSAGAALALRLAEEGLSDTVIGLNAALGKFEGMAGWAFPLAAQLLALNPFTALVVASTSSSRLTVRRILDSTGSRIDAEGLRLYQQLVGNPRHVDGTLRMMASWNLDPLLGRLTRNTTRTLFLAGQNDRTVPPEVSEKAAARMPDARALILPSLGHLAHEEAPEEVAGHVFTALAEDVVIL